VVFLRVRKSKQSDKEKHRRRNFHLILPLATTSCCVLEDGATFRPEVDQHPH
jgi:hypothetical protein